MNVYVVQILIKTTKHECWLFVCLYLKEEEKKFYWSDYVESIQKPGFFILQYIKSLRQPVVVICKNNHNFL